MHGIATGRSLAELLREPPALVFDGPDGVVTFSGAQVRENAEAAAGALAAAGIGAGDRVHLHLDNRPEFLFAWFACAGLGAVMVPTNPAATEEELRYVLEHSQARLTIAQPATAERARAAGATLLEDLSGGDPRPLEAHTGDLALLYTSGTTARPKAVRVTHANYLYAGEVVAGHLRLTDADRVFTALPLFHANAQYYTTMAALTAGATMILAHRFSAGGWLRQAAEHGATVGSLFAAPIRMILAAERPRHPHGLRVVLFAQNLTAAQHAAWEERIGAPLLQLYGMTETVGPPLMNPLRGERRPDALGRPTLGYTCKVVDGELLVGGTPGESLMAGYLGDDAPLADGWLRTGDVVRVDEDGYFHFVDRRKDMLKRAGENIAASEVEGVLAAHPAVQDVAVVGLPDPVYDERVAAFVVAPGADADELRAWCAERLVAFKVPTHIELRDALPRTAVGKIQKHLLKEER